jgi:hypothetical protein
VPVVISAREEKFMSVAAKINARRVALGLDLKTVAATRTRMQTHYEHHP